MWFTRYEKLCKSSLSLISSFFSYNHKSFYCDTSTNVVILYSPHMSFCNSYTNIKAKLFSTSNAEIEVFKVICAHFILQTFFYEKFQRKRIMIIVYRAIKVFQIPIKLHEYKLSFKADINIKA